MEKNLVFTKSIKGQAAYSDNKLSADEMAVIRFVDAANNVEQIDMAVPPGTRPHAEEILLKLARTGFIKPLIERREVSCESYCQAYKGMQFLSENEAEQRMLYEQKSNEEHARAEEWMEKCHKLHKRVEEYGNIFQGQLNNAKQLSQQYQKQFEQEQAARLKAEADYHEAQQRLKELDAELLDLRQHDEKLEAEHLIQEEQLTTLEQEESELVKSQLMNAKLLDLKYQRQFEEEQAARLKVEADYHAAQQRLKELDAELLDLRQHDEKLEAEHLIQEEPLTTLKQEESELVKSQLMNAKLLGQKYQRQLEEEQAARLKVEADYHEAQRHLMEKTSLTTSKQPDGELSTAEMALMHPYYHLVRPLGFCKNMSDAELSDLLFIAEWHNAKAGDTIYSEGEQGVVFYIVVSGKLRVVKRGRSLSALRTGDVFGELVFLSGGEPVRFEGVIAKTDCKLMVIDPAKLGNYALTFQLHVMEAFVRREVAKLYFAEERISNSLLNV